MAAPETVYDLAAGYLCVDYKPFFPIGLYAFPEGRDDDAMWEEAAAAGFNFKMHSGAGRSGLWTSVSTPTAEGEGRNRSAMNLAGDDGTRLGLLREMVAGYEGAPSVLCWHAPDEPSWFGPPAEELVLGYRALQRLSRKPVWLNFGPSFPVDVINWSRPESFVEPCDIVSVDVYPVPDGRPKSGQGYNLSLLNVGDYARRLVGMVSENGVQRKPVWMVLQGFSWQDLGGRLENQNPDCPPPTFRELRFMTYDAIVNGATGVLYWGTHSTSADSELWSDLKRMGRELSDLYPVLTAPARLEWPTFRVDRASVSVMIKRVGSRLTFLAVNRSAAPAANVRFNVGARQEVFETMEVRCEDRTVAVSNGTWSDDFEPYGVHVYETDAADPLNRY